METPKSKKMFNMGMWFGIIAMILFVLAIGKMWMGGDLWMGKIDYKDLYYGFQGFALLSLMFKVGAVYQKN